MIFTSLRQGNNMGIRLAENGFVPEIREFSQINVNT
jgi:hypothetical protein